jgi:hypothetical protein
MSTVDRSGTAVAARLSEALRLGRAPGSTPTKGVRTGGAAVFARIRQVDELRRLALRLRGRSR